MTDEVKDDLKVKELEDGSVLVGDQPIVADDRASEGDDVALKRADDDAGGEEQGHAAETEEEAEARKERNRQRRTQNKENRKNYVESLKRELASRDEIINELSGRVASVEQSTVGNQIAQIDAGLQEANNFYVHYKKVNQQAIELADGAAAVDAQEKMFAAQQRFNLLTNAKKNLTMRSQQPKPLDPRMQQHATDWVSRNPWYDPAGSDADSDLTVQIDRRLVQEGWNPTTKEYWEELDARVKKYLPHRANLNYNDTQGQNRNRQHSPVASSSMESGSKKGAYILSAERVKALKDAGIYDDPVKRADAIKRFQQFDKENA